MCLNSMNYIIKIIYESFSRIVLGCESCLGDIGSGIVLVLINSHSLTIVTNDLFTANFMSIDK